MKSSVLFAFLLIAGIAGAQSPIPTFYGEGSYPLYAVATTPTPIDQSATGANIAWNFDQLVEMGQSESHTILPTPAEVTAYPNTMLVNQTLMSGNGESYFNNLYFGNNAGTVSITGASNPEVTLNFSTDNATLGAFPMNFGFTNSDTAAGTFNYGTYNGTFSGTIATTVDAYGTLNMNLTGLDMSTPVAVTRLKTVLTASLTYIIPNIGSIVQTTYSYYAADMPGFPIFRSTTNEITVAVAGIDEEITTYESFLVGLLGTPSLSVTDVKIAKNPVDQTLEFVTTDAIESIEIIDLNGRIVARKSDATSIDVSHLKTGTYIASIAVNGIRKQQKFIKK